jgi:hypothetical protein
MRRCYLSNQTTRRHIQEDHILDTHRSENLKFHSMEITPPTLTFRQIPSRKYPSSKKRIEAESGPCM